MSASERVPAPSIPWSARIVRGAVCAAVLFVAWSVFAWLRSTAPVPPTVDQRAEAVAVTTIPAPRQRVTRAWEGFGSVAALDQADVPAEVGGRVVEVPPDVRHGRAVRRGQLLVRLDESDYRLQAAAALQQAQQVRAQMDRLDIEEAALRERMKLEQEDEKISQGELDRLLLLQDRNVTNQREIDLARRALIRTQQQVLGYREQIDSLPARRRQLEAQWLGQQETLALAELSLKRCRIESPIDGVLEQIDVHPGEWVTPGRRLVHVVNLDRVEVRLRLPTSAREDLQIGQPVRVTARGSDRAGRVTRISPVDDPATRTVTVFAEVDQQAAAQQWNAGARPQDLLWPGTFAAGRVSGAVERDRLLVPRRSVSAGRLWVVEEDGRVRQVTVRVDFSHEFSLDPLPDRQWLALHDVALAGKPVVLDSARSLADGQIVRALPPPAATENQP